MIDDEIIQRFSLDPEAQPPADKGPPSERSDQEDKFSLADLEGVLDDLSAEKEPRVAATPPKALPHPQE